MSLILVINLIVIYSVYINNKTEHFSFKMGVWQSVEKDYVAYKVTLVHTYVKI